MMETELLELVRSNPIQSQADNDNQVVQLWFQSRSQHTQRAYRANANRLFTYVGKSLALITLSNLQGLSRFLNCTGAVESGADTRRREVAFSLRLQNRLSHVQCRRGSPTTEDEEHFG